MPDIVFAGIATGTPMGTQVYEEQVVSRADRALAEHPGSWQTRRAVFRSMRSPLPGTHRLPMGALPKLPGAARRGLGSICFPRGALVHRMGLELPPGPHEVVTLHDVAAWRFPDESAPVPSAAEELRRAAAVICVSQSTADEAAEFLGLRNTVVIPNGVDERFLAGAEADPLLLGRLGIEGPYLLAAGGASRRKNLPALAEAWPTLKRANPDLTLVLSGPPHPARTRLFGALDGVTMVGRVPDEDVPALMAGASAMVVPSTYEGFGLPALEAMAVGTPVVASNLSSLPEVVGDAGILVAPTRDGIIAGVLEALGGGAEVAAMIGRGRARAAEYTWDRCARAHARVWALHAPGV